MDNSPIRRSYETFTLVLRTLYRLRAQSCENISHYQRKTLWNNGPSCSASLPNELYSWGIPKLRAAENWTRSSLDVIMDVYRRYVVGGMVAHRKSTNLAKKLIAETYMT